MSHTAPSSLPSADKENKTNPHNTCVQMAETVMKCGSHVGGGGCISYHSASNIKLHHPNLLLKPIPFSSIRVSSRALVGSTQSRSRIALQQIPLPFSVLSLLSCSLPGENHNSQQNKHLRQSSLAFSLWCPDSANTEPSSSNISDWWRHFSRQGESPMPTPHQS